MNNISILEFIKKSPKAELHLHIEGTLEPEQMFLFAKRNNIQILFNDVNEVKKGFECGMSIENFNDLKVGDIIEGYEKLEVKRELK